MSLLSRLANLGASVRLRIERLGYATRFLMFTFRTSPPLLLRPQLVIREIYQAGVLSLIVIGLSGLFVGMVLGLLIFEALSRFGSTDGVGVVVALAVVRELGPVLTAILFAARAGSAVSAEVGLMNATEQLKAIEMMAIEPIGRIIAPRFWGAVFSLPILVTLFNVIAILGTYLIAVVMLGVDHGTFWGQMQSNVHFTGDVLSGLLKSVVFGLVVAWIALFEGFDARPTAEGVSSATTKTVVTSALSIFLLDFILTAWML